MVVEDPLQLDIKDFKEWRNNGYPASNFAYTASLAGACATTSTLYIALTVISATKKADDVLISWRQGRRNSTQYPILEIDNEYTDWIIKMTH